MRRPPISALFIILVVCTQPSFARAGELTKEDICEAWARNAIMGARHALRDRGRALVPLSRAALDELIEHGGLRDLDELPVLDEQYQSAAARRFLEDSVFYGFDYAKRVPESDLPQEYDAIFDLFEKTCLEREIPDYR